MVPDIRRGREGPRVTPVDMQGLELIVSESPVTEAAIVDPD